MTNLPTNPVNYLHQPTPISRPLLLIVSATNPNYLTHSPTARRLQTDCPSDPKQLSLFLIAVDNPPTTHIVELTRRERERLVPSHKIHKTNTATTTRNPVL